jgi:photosystem II stability/assembly factor-like uncharacterized protein
MHSSCRSVVGYLSLLLCCVGLASCMKAPNLSHISSGPNQPLQRYEITQAIAANARTIVSSTQTGSVFVSSDTGKTWVRHALGHASLVDLAVCPDGSFVGIDFFHKVWAASADGSGWTSAALAKPGRPLAVTCDPSNRWWVVGTQSTIASSADRGATWSVSDLGEDAQLTTIQFVDEKTAIATGEFGIVARTSDAGKRWSKLPAIANEFYPYSTVFTSRNEGWTSGIAGQVLHTVDGGASWTQQDNATNAPLYRLFVHGGAPYGVGASGVIARHKGGRWDAIDHGAQTAQTFSAAASLTPARSIIVGGAGGPTRVVDAVN